MYSFNRLEVPHGTFFSYLIVDKEIEMKRGVLIIVGILLIGFAVFGFVTQKKSMASNNYKFYYYPKLNAYYDFQNKNFVYTLDGGKTWLTKEPASADLPEKLSEKVMLTGSVAQIWMDNASHRTEYHGIASDFKDNRPTIEKIGNNQSTALKISDLAPPEPTYTDSYGYDVAIEEEPARVKVNHDVKEERSERIETGMAIPGVDEKDIEKLISGDKKLKEIRDEVIREVIAPSEVGAKRGDSAE